jgi:HSP20 family protein
MDRLFDRAWDGQDFPTFGEWAPRVDLGETAEALTAKIEVPGIEPKDIHITLEHDILSIKGEKRAEVERKDEKNLRTERVYGSFERSLKLPAPVDAKRVIATFKNGLLVIEMPKSAEAKGTTIPIKIT